MQRTLLAALSLCLMLICGSAYADDWGKTADHYSEGMLGSSPKYHGEPRCKRQCSRPSASWNGTSLVNIETAAGSVTVSPSFASKISGFIRDAVSRGFKGRVSCYARGGHVRNSLHYSGNACDFAQRGWGRTVPPMYHVADIAAKWGLRDGCTFRRSDCGHIQAMSRQESYFASSR